MPALEGLRERLTDRVSRGFSIGLGVVEQLARQSVSRARAASGRWSPSCCVLSAAVGAQRLQVRRRVVVEVGNVDDFEALG